ncbi:MAG: hypothetical protein IMZ69_11235 [Spirochaetes bacterium]|nr:hypothetical protein [Spirochaetota bacterium]
MSITLPQIAGLLLVLGGSVGFWQVQEERVARRQWVGRALFAISFLCMGCSSLFIGYGSVASGALSIIAAVVAMLGFFRLRWERGV